MFVTRLISGIVLVIIALIALFTGGYVLAGLLLFLSLTAYRELMKACKLSGDAGKVSSMEIIGYVGIVIYYLFMVFTKEREFLFLTLIMILVAFMFLYVFTFPRYRAEQIMCSFFNVAYGPLMLSFIYLVRDLEYGAYMVFMIFISSWICDTCAYVVGMLIGKHKMAPKLSPKKSVEGAIGGVAGSVLVGALFGYFLMAPLTGNGGTTWIFALIGGVGAVISQVGDLAASAIKRNHEIKDYGKLIPGHGGVMDRFDSVIFTAPIIYLLLLVFV